MVMGSEIGSFQTQVRTTVGPEPSQIEKGDFDRDGHLDLAILSVGASGGAGLDYQQSLYVLRGDGNGGFSTPFVTVVGTSDQEARFATGDFNGDGWLDLALLEPKSQRLRIALNAAEPDALDFGEPANIVETGMDCQSLQSGDLNGDGRDDPIVGRAAAAGGDIKVFLSNTDGTATEMPAAEIGEPPTCLAVADVDGDGNLDVAAGTSGSRSDPQVALLMGDGLGGLGEAESMAVRGASSEIAAGDLDRSGLSDLVIAQPASEMLSSVLVERTVAGRSAFVRGDANSDGGTDISDAVITLAYLFRGRPIDCLEALDTNDDFEVDLSDPIYLLGFLFQGGDAPPAPFPSPAADAAEETLGCDR